MSIEIELCEFAVALRNADIPAEARRRAVDAITDCIGCAVAGAATPLAQSLTRALKPSGNGAIMLLGTPLRAHALQDAALYNGAVAHALDYDDVSHPAYAHPSAVLVPALLAAATETNASGADLITAYVVGLEVFGKLGRTLNLQHYKNGWHATSTLGSIAAATACARLLGLNAAQMRNALGMGASGAGGLRASFGTMTKPLHAGYAARNGVLAALLAREAYTAADTALTHDYGFFNTFNQNGGIDLAGMRNPGAPFEILTDAGIGLKPYPACAATHTAIEAAQLLRRQLGGNISEIEQVRVGMSTFACEPLIYVKPATALEAKFSMHYCVSAALALESVDLTTFSETQVTNPAITRLIDVTETYIDDRVRDDQDFASVVRVQTRRGDALEKLVMVPPGKPARWFTREQLFTKFSDCCGENNASSVPGGTEYVRTCFNALQACDNDQLLHELIATLAEMGKHPREMHAEKGGSR